MNAKAFILAAHGSRHQPAVNHWISQLADEVGHELGFEEAVATFHQGTPGYANILDMIQSKTAIIVPLMSSEGYYCNRVLPEQLAKNKRFNQVDLLITLPIGVHKDLPSLVCHRVKQLWLDHELEPSQTTIALVGHGSARAPHSRLATERLADSVRREAGFDHVMVAFLDEQPSVESIIDRSPTNAIVVIPFLIGVGPHAAFDIPLRLGLKTTATPSADRLDIPLDSARAKAHSSGTIEVTDVLSSCDFPITGQIDGTTLVCDGPIGTYPGIAGLVVDLARSACGVTTS